jgi:hypothetical protein
VAHGLATLGSGDGPVDVLHLHPVAETPRGPSLRRSESQRDE